MARYSLYLILVLFCALGEAKQAKSEDTLVPRDEILLSGNAYWDPAHPGEIVVLTANVTNQVGTATILRDICAREYRTEYEVYLGDDTGSAGGAYFTLYELNADGAEISRLGLDTYYDVPLNPAYEINGNHAEVWTCNAKADQLGNVFPSGRGCGPVAATALPFRLEGSGWFKIIGQMKDGMLSYQILDAAGDGVVLGAKRQFSAGQEIRLMFRAVTGAAHNTHRVRNIRLEILENSNCDGQLQLAAAEAQTVINQACANSLDCENAAQRRTCSISEIESLYAEQLISNAVREELLEAAESQALYCQGFVEGNSAVDVEAIQRAGYESGFAAGQAAVDTAALEATAYEAGYQAGYAAVDQQAIESFGYQNGYAAGAASIDLEAIRQAAYEQGYAAGVQSVPACELEQRKPSICHRQGGKRKTLEVNMLGFVEHLLHGDTPGPC